jgi:hypothetical protein
VVQLAQPHSECSISKRGEYIRAGRPSEILECYRSLVTLALEQKFKLALLVGTADDDASHHLAARDAAIAFHEIGVPAGVQARADRGTETWHQSESVYGGDGGDSLAHGARQALSEHRLASFLF